MVYICVGFSPGKPSFSAEKNKFFAEKTCFSVLFIISVAIAEFCRIVVKLMLLEKPYIAETMPKRRWQRLQSVWPETFQGIKAKTFPENKGKFDFFLKC